MIDIDGASFLTGANAGFIDDLHARFLDDPGSVDESWQLFFRGNRRERLGGARRIARAPLG